MQLHCANRVLDLSSPVVMGILNITPDSFSDGGVFFAHKQAQIDHCLRAAEKMLADGARALDIGGESTRPHAQPVSSQEEMARVLPVVEAIAVRLDVVISVDTSNPQVMREAAALGAGMINDVRALQREGALQTAAQTGLPVCLMHMQGEPENMQDHPHYDDVVTDVAAWLQQRAATCVQAGIAPQNILLDPGFGFGKTLEHNVDLLRRLDVLAQLPYPLLVGLSRKSIAGKLTGKPVEERLPASLALAQMALDRGARILRVHDVAETVDMVRVWCAINEKN
ncbi:MAG: dihydropteroate synthase [Cellvibrionales bacterium]|jgi:dihydropteroate synthase|nr:dihydropteroate synthase [Cellvibrionales bacterium]